MAFQLGPARPLVDCEGFKVGFSILADGRETMSSTAGKLELDSVVIRFGGEMGIKGPWTRRIYEHRLLENIKSTLKRDKIVYKGFLRKHGRPYLKTSSVKEASSSLSKVFGI